MANLEKAMANVMAALHTFGVEYDTCSSSAVPVKVRMADLLKEKQDVVDFVGFIDGGKAFRSALTEFLKTPGYGQAFGCRWAADDDGYVVIQLGRLYRLTEEDWQAYAEACGCASPEEAQCDYGDPSPVYSYLNVRVEAANLSAFIHRTAKYCWC